MPSEAGYDELRRVFDFLKAKKHVGPVLAGEDKESAEGEVSITVIDADDLLDNPEGIISAYCKEVGIEYSPQMLIWDTEEDHQRARDAFEKWRGFHDDAINSTSLKPRSAAHVSLIFPLISKISFRDFDWLCATSLFPGGKKHPQPPPYNPQEVRSTFIEHQLTNNPKKKKDKTIEVENAEWKQKYGEEGQKIIRETVEANIADYEYLKSFAIKV